MNKLSKAKRDQLILCLLGMCVGAATIWQVLLVPAEHKLKELRKQADAAGENLATARRQAGLASRSLEEMEAARLRVDGVETRMVEGDPYRWLVRTFMDLPFAIDVSIASIEPPQVGELKIPPRLPYQGATFGLSGNAYYRDFGRFLARLENTFPHMRVKTLALEPANLGDVSAQEDEKLQFHLQLTTLVKPKPALAEAKPAVSGSRQRN